MIQEIEMTAEEQMTMYMKCSKKELCKMLIEANRHLKNLPIHVVVGSNKKEEKDLRSSEQRQKDMNERFGGH